MTDIIGEIIRLEGGYINDPDDSGGVTNYGITERVARDYGYEGAMEDLTKQGARYIYTQLYFEPIWYDKLRVISVDIANEVADTAVNMGVKRSVIFLQQCLNALNDADLVQDGVMGDKTYGELKTCRDYGILLKALNCLQGEFYITLANNRRKDRKFVYGWLKNRVRL